MNKGDERYTFIDSETVRKVDRSGVPDMQGLEYKFLAETEGGYQVFMVPEDPSQPSPIYFIPKQYFYERTGKESQTFSRRKR